MVASTFRRILAVGIGCVVGLSWQASAQNLQFITLADPQPSPVSGGSGDSRMPILSHDGRFVVFAGTANNLLQPAPNASMPGEFPPHLNVFRRDRLTGTTTLVSVDSTGGQGGDGDSLPLGVSNDGRFVLFQSEAPNLLSAVKTGANRVDLYVRDLEKATTTLVSANTNGQFSNGSSRDGSLTPDGRFVAFVSEASDLVARDTNLLADVFVRDQKTGATTLVSVGALPNNTRLQQAGSEAPDITPDGRYVAFYTTASNLFGGAKATSHILVRDILAGTTTWTSIGAQGAIMNMLGQSNVACFNHAISSDGMYLVYEASAPLAQAGIVLRYDLKNGTTTTIFTNASVPVAAGYQYVSSLAITPDARHVAFIANEDSSNHTTCVKVWDSDTGTVSLASGDPTGLVPNGSTCDWPGIDDSGRYVAFQSTAAGLVTNATAAGGHLFIRDRQAASTSLLDAEGNQTGSSIDPASAPVLSGDGRFAAFESEDSNLVRADMNRDSDVFVRDLSSWNIELISAHEPALGSTTPNGPSFLTSSSASADGRFVTFASEASNLVPNDTNRCRDIFVRDLQSQSIRLVSGGADGSSANGSSWDPVMSGDGRYVAWTSLADNLAGPDTNQDRDVFVRDLLAGKTTLVSVNTNGTGSGNRASFTPVFSLNAPCLLFQSKATDLNSGTTGSFFYRDLNLSSNIPLPATFAASTAALSPDGRRVFYWDVFLNRPEIWEPLSAALPVTFTGIPTSILPTEASFSPDGSKIAICVSAQTVNKSTLGLWVLNANDVSKPAESIDTAATSGAQWNGDGTKLVYVRKAGPAGTSTQVWLHDFVAGTNLLVSHSFADSTSAADGKADSPSMSKGGRWIAYRSSSTNIVLGTHQTGLRIFLYDVAAAANTLFSEGSGIRSSTDDRPHRPFFSSDGKLLFFASWTSGLLSGDFNHNSDLFAYSLFYVTYVPSETPSQGCTITWPCTSGRQYRVEYKEGFADTAWHEVAGLVKVENHRASLQDTTFKNHRIYRVVSF